MDREADLHPPLGKPGGPCQVVERIEHEVHNPRMQHDLVEEVEDGQDLTNQEASKIYHLDREPGVGPIRAIQITSHGQYRMDLRQITVDDVRAAIASLLKQMEQWKALKSPAYENMGNTIERGEQIAWVDPRSKLKIVFQHIGSGTIVLITTYWKGVGSNHPSPQQCTPHQRLSSASMSSRIVARFLRNRRANQKWYHLTDRAKFKLDPKFTPSDNAFALEDRSGRAGIYLAPRIENWLQGQGYWRPFVAEFRVDSGVKDDPGVNGRWGGEMFVPASSFHRLELERVIPIDAYAREKYGGAGWIETAVGREFDTGNPLPPMPQVVSAYRGYHYPGPDVRNMPAGKVTQLKKDLREAKRKGL
jgi:hypothetical protein